MVDKPRMPVFVCDLETGKDGRMLANSLGTSSKIFRYIRKLERLLLVEIKGRDGFMRGVLPSVIPMVNFLLVFIDLNPAFITLA